MISKKFVLIIAAVLLAGAFLFFRSTPERSQVPEIGDGPAFAIDSLTREAIVVPYVKKHRQLPACYITKAEAREKGWDAASGNLCDVLPGRAIGGDVFGNREGGLPAAEKRKWFEADLNYKCGRRNADRLLYSSDGLIYVTYDHYKTFEQR